MKTNAVFVQNLLQHQNSLGNTKKFHSEAAYNCNECEESFKLKKNLKRHIENVHLKVECCCEICGQRFPRQDSLKRHKELCKKKHEKRENKEFEKEMTEFFDSINGAYQNKFKEFASKKICHQCSKAFSNKATLKTHVSDVHNSGIDKKTCQFCSHTFSSKSNF